MLTVENSSADKSELPTTTSTNVSDTVSIINNRTLIMFSSLLRHIEHRAGFNWWEAWGEIKIEGFGGRPPFGGRPGTLGPMGPPLNPALVEHRRRLF